MKRRLLTLTLTGVIVACSDAGGVDPEAIPGPELDAVRMALDSAFLHDTSLDPAFTGDSALYALMSVVVFPFMDRATRIAQGYGGAPTGVARLDFGLAESPGR